MRLHSVLTILSLLFIGFYAPSLQAQAQQYFTIRGKVGDQTTEGEGLPNAHIMVIDSEENLFEGVVSDDNGEYLLTLPKGEYTVICRYIGFAEKSKKISLNSDLNINWVLAVINLNVIDVFVVVEPKDIRIMCGACPSFDYLGKSFTDNMPTLSGEKDILKTIQLLPGVSPTAEANADYYVRGGAADQNLILLDEIPVYKPTHLLSFLGVFNSEIIADASLMKGNAPAQFGGRLASVLSLEMKQGNEKKTTANGGFGLLSSKISLSTPIQKDKSSLMIAARRSNTDFLLKPISKFKDYKLFFYDLNLKATYELNARNMLFFSAYMGADFVSFAQRMETKGGNMAANLRWRSIINPKFFTNTSLIFSRYEQNTKLINNNEIFTLNTALGDYTLKSELRYFANYKSNWRFGVNSTHRRIQSIRSIDSNKTDKLSLENVAYVSNEYNINKNISTMAGLRLSAYSIQNKTYVNLEPRLAMSYQFNEKVGAKIAYSRNVQHLHRLSNHNLISPTEQWVGNSYHIKPEISDQVSAGFYRIFRNGFQLTAEVYHKNMQNQIEYKNGADINTAPNLESELLFGKGRAYGAEFYFKKHWGKFRGWISYSLARSEQQTVGVNNNNWYASRQDRRHDISVVAIYHLNTKWSVSGVFEYYTGSPIYYQTGQNNYKMPNHHRLDLGATYKSNRKNQHGETKRFQDSWDFVLYNAYGSRNVYDLVGNASRPTTVSLFRWLPSVSYNFSF